MKLKFPFIFLFLFSISDCTYDYGMDNGVNDAVITGFDYSMCACCGGLIISINGFPSSLPDKTYRIDNLPSDLGINNSTRFPIYLKIRWLKLNKCSGRYIRIDWYQIEH